MVGVPGAEVVAGEAVVPGAAVMPDVVDTGFANGKRPLVSVHVYLLSVTTVQCHRRKERFGRWNFLFERLMKCTAHHKPVVVASVATG